MFKGSEIDDVGGLGGPGGLGNPFKKVGGKADGKFSSVFGPNVAPRCLQTVRDLKMVKNVPQISPGDKFESRFVTMLWSGPTIKNRQISFRSEDWLPLGV